MEKKTVWFRKKFIEFCFLETNVLYRINVWYSRLKRERETDDENRKKSQRGKKSICYIFVEQFYFHVKMEIEISKHSRLRIFNATINLKKRELKVRKRVLALYW